METLPFYLFASLAVCLMQCASSLKCQACGPEGPPCGGANVPSIDCEAGADRCMTVTMTMDIPNVGRQTMMMKNCSSFAMVCQEQSLGYPCKPGGLSPGATCKITCCVGDLCNKASAVPTVTVSVPSVTMSPGASATDGPTNSTVLVTFPAPTSAVSVLAASFGAILLAVVLNMFA